MATDGMERRIADADILLSEYLYGTKVQGVPWDQRITCMRVFRIGRQHMRAGRFRMRQ
jgi:hypothetical protein